MNTHPKSLGAIAAAAMLISFVGIPSARAAAAPESQRLERAKDLIADEQWARAAQELKAAVADPKEKNKDEALFWLAQSQKETHDTAAAIDTLRRLEREFPRSRWVKPAQSMRIEIAQRLHRNDFLWYTAAPPPPPAPAPPAAAPPTPGVPPAVAAPVAPPVPGSYRMRPPRPATTMPAPPAPPPASAPPAVPGAPPTPRPPKPPAAWVVEGYLPDTDLRIQALGSLIHTDSAKVIPMLKEIALESENPGQARRALWLLTQSGQPEARSTVVEVAKTGPEFVRLAAVRELGRLQGPAVSTELLQIYSTGNENVKYQVVTSLGQRDATSALLRIVQSEKDRGLRNIAIATLGEAGGRDQLFTLYQTRASAEAKAPIINGLFNARAVDELIRIAESEKAGPTRQLVLSRLRLLGTPKAKQYLEKSGGK